MHYYYLASLDLFLLRNRNFSATFFSLYSSAPSISSASTSSSSFLSSFFISLLFFFPLIFFHFFYLFDFSSFLVVLTNLAVTTHEMSFNSFIHGDVSTTLRIGFQSFADTFSLFIIHIPCHGCCPKLRSCWQIVFELTLYFFSFLTWSRLHSAGSFTV